LELVWFAFVTDASITVVIPAHNAAQTLLRALHSVAQQTLQPAEIIVSNDVSTDNTLQLAKEYAAASAIPMRVLDMPSNVGPGGTRNAAWNVANTEFVAFLDADDQWHPQKLQLQHNAMLQCRVTRTASQHLLLGQLWTAHRQLLHLSRFQSFCCATAALRQA
jgi:glycosyltransferase involved in cell wall biosynthesis